MKIVHISFSPLGGPGRVASALNELLLELDGISSRQVYLHEANLRKKPLRDPQTSLLSLSDELLAKNNSSSSMITLFRSFRKKIELDSDLDIIHLHWWYDLDLDQIARNHPGSLVVISLHDDRAFTGACHSAGACSGYEDGCSACPIVRSTFRKRVSANFLETRRQVMAPSRIKFTAPSEDMRRRAVNAGLEEVGSISLLPNPIDSAFWTEPENSEGEGSTPDSRKLKIGFIAQNLNDSNKRLDRARRFIRELRRRGLEAELQMIGGGLVSRLGPHEVSHGALGTSEIVRVARSWDAVVSCSDSENASLAIVEMAALGVVTITHHSSSSAEIMAKTGQQSVITDWEQQLSQEDYRKVLELLLQDEGCRSRTIRAKAKTNFGAEAVRRRLLEIYEYQS